MCKRFYFFTLDERVVKQHGSQSSEKKETELPYMKGNSWPINPICDFSVADFPGQYISFFLKKEENKEREKKNGNNGKRTK
jgi:hypothetical protein